MPHLIPKCSIYLAAAIVPFLFSFKSLNIKRQQDPVHWQFTARKVSPKAFAISLQATIDHGWHIYSMFQPKDAIADPTTISFTTSPVVVVHGPTKEVGRVKKQKLPDLDLVQNMFERQVEFVQSVELRADVKTNISGTITYQACTEEMCLPTKTIPFTVSVP